MAELPGHFLPSSQFFFISKTCKATLMSNNPHKNANIVTTGEPLASASTAMILLHGRGATAAGILDLKRVLNKEGMHFLAPEAVNHTWYPYRFIAPTSQNEPYLSSALALVDDQVQHLEQAGISRDRIVIAGFSQGACLASEYVARNPARYGGLIAFSGGLIGAPEELPDYQGSLDQTPVFLGCSDYDPHIPLQRVNETAQILEGLGATVNKQIYPQMGHTIIADEIKQAQIILENLP